MDFDSKPRDLPADAQLILATLNAPFRIISHLSLVHDTAPVILEAIQKHSTALIIDADVFLFGAAIHDIGKTLHPNEVTGSGSLHEFDGPVLLQQYGLTFEIARFALTIRNWQQESSIELQDFLVALGDTVWKGSRNPILESIVAIRISEKLLITEWEVFLVLGDLFQKLPIVARQDWGGKGSNLLMICHSRRITRRRFVLNII